ncbi:MAG TPA: histidine triad nucleotide-binding protein [Salinisphaeraceae bacterium]|nr:histidine triad nucleotide-binding protein [Salinisphaeraceae bacterium]
MSETIFSKIINREIDADIVYEDDLCLAFRDIQPQAPLHVLVIPKKPIDMLTNAGDEDQALLGHMLLKARDIAREEGYADCCRVVTNCGAQADQTVFHLHLHVLGGRRFSWPPG